MGFFSLEALLIDRIKSKVPSARQVLSLSDFAEIKEGVPKQLPAVLVLFSGYRVADQRAGAAKIEQLWAVVAIAKAVRQTAGKAKEAREDVGGLVDEILSGLLGWRPSLEHSAMALEKAGFTPDVDSGTIFIPVGFSTSLVVKGEESV